LAAAVYASIERMRVDLGDVSFDMLVESLAASALVHLGDQADRATGAKVPPHPDAAVQMIQLLALLEEKTQGNLDEREVQLLTMTLRVLRTRLLEVRKNSASGQISVT
tara:strand:- start:773 stop:1096 length:324 start_codon:yes stop_codon:yes gene_type:complete